MTTVLITGAGGSASYNFVDALKLSGRDYRVIGVDSRKYHLPLTKTEKNYLVPLASSPEYIPTLNRIIEKERVDFLHAQPDPEVDVLSVKRGELATKLFLPKHETILACGDKMRFNQLMRQGGVDAPLAFPIKTAADVEVALAEILKKVDRAWLRAIRGAGSRASLPVKKVEHALAWIDYWKTMRNVGFGDFMMSEFLPGKEFAFQSLWFEGKLVAAQARQRVEYIFGHLTPSGQSSSPSVAVSVHRPDVNDVAQKAILAVDKTPHGIFCVDMKEDVAGVPRPTEVNCGRFFTTSNFFAHAGVNMPDLYVQLATGAAPPSTPLVDVVPPDVWWVRMIDMGCALVRDDQWNYQDL